MSKRPDYSLHHWALGFRQFNDGKWAITASELTPQSTVLWTHLMHLPEFPTYVDVAHALRGLADYVEAKGL